MNAPILQRHWIEVGCEGELVTLIMGHLKFTIEFPLALQMAAAMKYQARLAKLNSGNDHRGLHVLGDLRDLNAPAQPPRKLRRVERIVGEQLKPRGLDMYAEGQLVVLKIGKMTAHLPFDCARDVSQWLRLRGKEAKRNAGEREHWSRLAGAAVAEDGGLPWRH